MEIKIPGNIFVGSQDCVCSPQCKGRCPRHSITPTPDDWRQFLIFLWASGRRDPGKCWTMLFLRRVRGELG